jgi:hypothetical protein
MGIEELSEYYRTCIADKSLMGLERKSNDETQQEAPFQQIESGAVDQHTTSKLFKAWAKKNNIKEDEDGPTKLPVLVCPYCYSLKSSHGSSYKIRLRGLCLYGLKRLLIKKGI